MIKYSETNLVLGNISCGLSVKVLRRGSVNFSRGTWKSNSLFTMEGRTPVLVGCGRFTQKKQQDWRDYSPPDRLMAEASSRALRDTSVSPERVLSALDAIAGNSVVPDRFLPYTTPKPHAYSTTHTTSYWTDSRFADADGCVQRLVS